MSQGIEGPKIGGAGGRPVVEGQNSGLTRGISGFHPAGQHPTDIENEKARTENGDVEAVAATAKKSVVLGEGEEPTELEGTIGADGKARAAYERNGIEHVHEWDPEGDAPAAAAYSA